MSKKWVVLYVILLALCIITLNRVLSLQTQLGNLENNLLQQIANVPGQLNSQIANNISQIDAALARQEQIFFEHQAEIQKFNPSDKTIDLALSVTPKAVNPGDQIYFVYVADGKPNQAVPAELSGNSYAAKVKVPLCNQLKIYANIKNGEQQQTQLLEDYADVLAKFQLQIDSPSFSGSFQYHEGVFKCDGAVQFTIYHTGNNQPQNVKCQVFVNDGAIKSYPVTVNDDLAEGLLNSSAPVRATEINPQDITGQNVYSAKIADSFDAYEGDTIWFTVTFNDTNGFSYSMQTETWLIKDGQLEMDPANFGQLEVH